ncbi:MAG: TlpA family protein disulfide reductase [Planctomycetota bacterium]
MQPSLALGGTRPALLLASLLLLPACGDSNAAKPAASAPSPTRESAPPAAPSAARAPAAAASIAVSEVAAQVQPPPAVKAPPDASKAAAPAVAKPAPAPAAPSQPLLITFPELLKRRDLWPAQVKLTQRVTFAPNDFIDAGRELDLVNMNTIEIELDSGAGLFSLPPDQTDLLQRASAIMAALTPEQLALTDVLLRKRPELWPVEVSVTRTLGFAGGKTIPAGRTVILRTFQGGELELYDRNMADHFPASVHETDVLARARERLKLPEPERTPFFLRAQAAALQPTGDAKQDATFLESDYVLVYQARLGCGRCAQFVPKLREAYDRLRTAHKNFEVVWHSADFNVENAKKVLEEEKLPGRVVAYDKRLELADLGVQNGDLLPLVYLFDRDGKLLLKNQGRGGAPTGEDVLAALEKELTKK